MISRDRDDALHPAVFDDQVCHFLLEERQVRVVLQHRANRAPVQLAVRLRAGGSHCRAFAGVERAELDARAVGCARHGATQCIDLPHQMAFADTAHGRIAAHLPQRLDALGEQQRLRAHARGGEGRFSAGVTATDDDDLEGAREAHGVWGSRWDEGLRIVGAQSGVAKRRSRAMAGTGDMSHLSAASLH